MRAFRVRSLLMGGQACVFYGAAEFSRDTDFAIICRRLARRRALLVHAQTGKAADLGRALLAEETAERRRDREYWLPLRRELEKLRHNKR
jgi:hypothetical protein